jgi:uncharacterized protein YjiK
MINSLFRNRFFIFAVLITTALVGIRLYPIANANLKTLIYPDARKTFSHERTISLPHITSEASGVAYHPQTKSLFIILGTPPTIYEISTEGKPLRTITLRGFKDTEGIAWISGNEFAIIEERTCSIILVNLASGLNQIERKNSQKIELSSINSSNQNQGCEDITWHPSENSFYIVKEKNPAIVYRVAYNTFYKPDVTTVIDNAEFPIIGKDLSGLYFDRHKQSLFMLSDESRKVTHLQHQHTNGPTAFLDFNWFGSGLIKPIPQAEGVTMDEQGNLFVVSEPNLLYVFSAIK